MEAKTIVELIKVLNEFTYGGHQFTCFDITKELRSRGQQPDHQEVREVVHAISADELLSFEIMSYGRHTVSFMTHHGQDTAEVYRQDTDLRDYDPYRVHGQDGVDGVVNVVPSNFKGRSIMKTTSVTAVKTVPKPAKVAAKTVVIKKTDEAFTVDQRGRICIRNSVVKTFGLQSGDRAYLRKWAGGGGFDILKSAPTTNYIGSLKVDKYGNIRVGRKPQKKAKATSRNFTMLATSSFITVEAS